MLVERVTIIIHAAASVRFNNSLKYAIFVNTRATRDICILAQNMKNLIVSTTKNYDFISSNCYILHNNSTLVTFSSKLLSVFFILIIVEA